MRASNILWHYTDADGFYGIVTTNKLHLSDARFLNDRTERTYGTGVVLSVLERLQKLTSNAALHAVQEELRKPHTTNLFICSFSERSESMSQWERYADRGFGYCLGFSKSEIARSISEKPIELRRMIYSVRRQKAMLQIEIEKLLQEYGLTAGGSRQRSQRAMYALVVALALEELALQLKNPDFREEREWRLIRELRQRSVKSPADPLLKFANRGHLVKPHIEMMLPSRSTTVHSRLPLVSVVCGPKLERDVAIASATYFLAENGYHVPVKHSALSAIWR
jgi:hypothetical protein